METNVNFFPYRLSSSLANDKRKLRPQRKQRTSANPMKSLHQRDDLIDEVVVADKQKVCSFFIFVISNMWVY